MNTNQKFVYVITNKGERKYWTKVGVAFVNRDGSLNVNLDCLPVDGKLHIRESFDRDEKKENKEKHTDVWF